MNFLDKVLKNHQLSNFMKIRPVGVEFFQTDGWLDRLTGRCDEANSLILQFCECA